MRKLITFTAFCYLALYLYFPNIGWGVAFGNKIFNLYDRGSGVFPLPLMNILLYLIYIATAFLAYQQRNVYNYFNLRFYFWAFNALFLIFCLFGIATGISFKEVFSSKGLVNVLNLYLFILILLKTISTPEKLTKVTDLIIFVTLTRGIWGLLRWAFLGGDPANVYANVQKIALRITFFDINDNLIATMGVFLAAWLLLYKKGIPSWRKLFYFATIAVGLAVILLSYRRTAWGGLVLAGFWFVWQQPWRRRIQVGFITGLIGMLTLPVLIGDRFAQIRGTSKSGILYDITTSKGGIDAAGGRFSELNYAWRYISESPLTGVLPWGGIGFGKSHDFVHSGLIHLWLKGGFFAFLLFTLILWHFYIFTKKVRREIPASERGLAEAAFAGLLFSMPNILFGTPFIETRTSILLGFIFALPYLVYGLNKQQEQTQLISYTLKNLPKTALQLKLQ